MLSAGNGSDPAEARSCTELERVTNEEIRAMVDAGASVEEVAEVREAAEAERIRLQEAAVEADNTAAFLACENVQFYVFDECEDVSGDLDP